MIVDLKIRDIECPICTETLRDNFHFDATDKVVHEETQSITCKNCHSKIDFAVNLVVTFDILFDTTNIDNNQISLF